MKLYLETTVPNFLFADDSPEKKAATEDFFEWLRICPDTILTSTLVEAEISHASEPLRSKLIEALVSVPLQVLKISPEADGLAKAYVKDGVIPVRFEADALHVAIAVCAGVDVLVSWNMKHLVNVHKIKRINEVNLRYGLPPIRIHTPEEMLP